MPKQRDRLRDLRAKTPVELTKLLATSREELRDLRFRVANKQLNDVREIRELRHRVAQIQTLLKSQPKPQPATPIKKPV